MFVSKFILPWGLPRPRQTGPPTQSPATVGQSPPQDSNTMGRPKTTPRKVSPQWENNGETKH